MGQESETSSIHALRRVLRYQPELLRRMDELLSATASHLPRLLARHVVAVPSEGPLVLAIEGTMAFADIDGFTPLSERFAEAASEAGAEELTELVNRFLAILINTTATYGGDIQKFGGDAGMLLFTGDDHALRAAVASLRVQEVMAAQMSQVETSLGRFPLRIAIGMGSGRMVGVGLGDDEGREWLIGGPPLRAMGRAQNAAPPGSVVLDHTTWQLHAETFIGETMPDNLFLVRGTHHHPAPHPLKPLPAPPDLDPPSHLDWLLSRLDALAPYLAPGLLERLTTAVRPTAVQPWSEHRQVTILMLSLSGFPDLSIYWHNPEALQRAVEEPNRLFIQARDIIRRYDGIVNKIGASPKGAYLMVLFGAPTSHEDDPLRAVLAALELQAQLHEPLRIGINTGFVFAGDVGTADRREYTVMGDAVNLAHRLMSACLPGEIWLGPDTARHPSIRHRVEGEWGEPHKFKGKKHPIPPFIARRVRRIWAGVEMESLPLIGRDTEMAALREMMQTLLNEGRPRIIAVHGAAGCGKSRLVYALAAEAERAGLWVGIGVAPSYGAHLPYAAWNAPLRKLLALENVPADAQADALHAAMKARGLDAWTALIAPLVGIDFPPSPEVAALPPELREQRRRETLRALWQTDRQQPRLLVLENAQWLPETSLTLLDALIAAPPEGPLMLVLTYRDDDALTARWAEHPVTHVPLPSLPRRQTLTLARHVARVPRLPREVERWIVRRGGGIPLFTIEAVRSLIASGILERDDGHWRLSHPLDEAPLPETAYGLLQSRIDQLAPPARHLLRAATVVGEQMTVDMLVAGYGEEPRPAVERRLPQLAPLGLIPGDAQYETLVFRQPLVREVAYRGLPVRMRRLIHRRLSEYLDRLRDRVTSNWLTLLGHHAFEGQSWELAVRSNLELGARARRSYLLEQAVTAYRRVLKAVEAGGLAAPQAQLEAHRQLGRILTILGKYTEAMAHFDEVRRLLPAVPTDPQDIERLGELEHDVASVYISQGRYREAMTCVDRGLALPGVAERLVGARLQMEKAGLFNRLGQYDEEMSWERRVLELTSTLSGEEALRIRGRAFYMLAWQLTMRGRIEQAQALAQESLNIFRQLQDLMGELKARNNLILIHLALGQWRTAVEHGERGLRLAQRIRYAQGEAQLAANLGEVYRHQGRLAEARRSYTLALDLAQARGISYGAALMENNLAAIALMEQNWREAETRLDRAAALFDELGAKSMLPELYRHRGELAIATGNPTEGITWARRAIQLAEQQGDVREAGQAQRILAEAYLASGICEQAWEALTQALAIAQANHDRYRTAQARLTEARWHRQCGDPAQALAPLRRAVETFEELGAAWDLRQAQSLEPPAHRAGADTTAPPGA